MLALACVAVVVWMRAVPSSLPAAEGLADKMIERELRQRIAPQVVRQVPAEQARRAVDDAAREWIERNPKEVAAARDRRLMVRLVKGAYWDTEVKRAQERGLADYPVFTRKAMTDLCYLDCAHKLLNARPRLYPQFATHNALTVASVIEDAGGTGDFEFQRLHGMGEALYEALLAEMPDIVCRVYAPVGRHADLLAYLVRRLLENGANSSFVSLAADPAVPVETVLRRPQSWIAGPAGARHPHIPLPRDLFAPRRNSAGVEFGDAATLATLRAEIAAAPRHANAATAAGLKIMPQKRLQFRFDALLPKLLSGQLRVPSKQREATA